MKTQLLKTGYAFLMALVVATQLIAAPIALTAEQTEQSIAEGPAPNADCVNFVCGM